MPVKKTSKKAKRTFTKKTVPQDSAPHCAMCESVNPMHHVGEHARRIFLTLFGILLVYIIVWMASLIRNNLQEFNYIGQAGRMERTITVSASDKVTIAPDTAVTTIGMNTNASTVAAAQAKNSAVMNTLITKLKSAGVDEADIQTQNYNIYPRYNYTEEDGRVLNGYDVNQQVKIKIRDLDKANSILALAGEVGANTVSGLQFIVDDPDIYKMQAREKALLKARIKALRLADSLGVDIVGIVSYNEFGAGNDSALPYKAYAEVGFGGAAPQIESGSSEIEMNVNVTYEIR